MIVWHCRLHIPFIVLVAMVSLSCATLKNLGKEPPLPTLEDLPPTTRIAEAQTLVLPPQELRPVKTGSLPLVYLLEHPGQIRVIDATSGVVITTTQAGGRTILKIDADSGVSIGGKTIRNGPFDPTHQYEIYLISPSDNVRSNVYERR